MNAGRTVVNRLTPPQAPRGRAGPGRRARWLPCWLLCAGLAAAGALQAATVSAPDAPPGTAAALGDAAPWGAAPPSRVLDKALTSTVSTGNKNLDLLLEMQRNDAAAAHQAGPGRPGPAPASTAGTAAAKSLTASTLPQTSGPPDKSALSQSPLLGNDGALGALQKAAVSPPDWTGAGGPAGRAGMGAGAAGGLSGSADDRQVNRPHDETDDGSFRFWPRRARDFIRDNRAWLLGGMAGLLLLGAAAQAYSRRA